MGLFALPSLRLGMPGMMSEEKVEGGRLVVKVATHDLRRVAFLVALMGIVVTGVGPLQLVYHRGLPPLLPIHGKHQTMVPHSRETHLHSVSCARHRRAWCGPAAGPRTPS